MNRYLDRRLKFRHLRVIEAIASHQSLVKAANALCLTQPALTRSLQDIEEILGVRLFERHSKGVTVTVCGQVVADAARGILNELNRVEGALDKILGRVSATVTIGALPVAAAGLLPAVLARLNEVRDDLEIRLVQGLTAELVPQLSAGGNAGGVDMIVGCLYEPATPDGMAREVLYHEPISLLARADHPLFLNPGAGKAALRNYKLVLPTVAQLVGQETDAILAAEGLEDVPCLRSNSIGFIREMLVSSDFVALMPRLMLAGDLLRGEVRVLPLLNPVAPRPAGIIYHPDREFTPGAQAVIDALKSYIRDVTREIPSELAARRVLALVR